VLLNELQVMVRMVVVKAQ